MRKYIHISEVEKHEILIQHNLLLKEQYYGFGSPIVTLKGQNPQGSINLGDVGNFILQNPHESLPVLSVITALIPVIGPYLSTILGLQDAFIYYKEGDNYNAGLALFFETIPLWGGALRIGSKAAIELSEKIIGKKVLSETEQSVINFLKTNMEEMQKRFKSWLGSKLTGVGLSNVASERLTNAGINVGIMTGKLTGEIAQAQSLSAVYDATYQATTGASFKSAQKWFLSNKSAEDNILMDKALKSGWKPGDSVPEKYQTNLYKKDLEDLNSLDYGALQQFIKNKNA